jgi:hypothetical protein
MLRILTLAAVAAMAVAAPASAESIRVSAAGKSPEQFRAEVSKAAVQVCRAEYAEDTLAVYLVTPCARAAVKAALAPAGDSALKVAAR